MYLARRIHNRKRYYFIRESVLQDGVYVSKDLMDLGPDPSQYLVYPGSRSFYIHEDVQDHLDGQDVSWDYDDLEDIFWPFLHPETKRSLEGFKCRDTRSRKKTQLSNQEDDFIRHRLHPVDKRRYNYLRLGELDQSKLTRIPTKFYRPLVFKSRDELEQIFLDMELRILGPSEYALYVYSFLYLRSFFSELVAGKMPQGLDPEKVDELCLQELCRLNRDESFWKGMDKSGWLHPYLVRYVIMYFDYPFGPTNFMYERIQDFIARNRSRFQMPTSKQQEVSLDEASEVMGVSRQKLGDMSQRELGRLYRRRAFKMHPDRGGDHDRFIRLTKAYQALIRRAKHKQ